eukprot:TRINITY_DN260_c1_g1_i1.p1 TRINITY_DN260_c1_g1~~TRINITY_DN260_c1_g1_i1.p1  ORF type:complete len:1044 (-),score=442.88 TRINITY_DN260_c1_g1_i1:79-3210(-)
MDTQLVDISSGSVEWTIEKLKDGVPNWTLASDVGLIQYLENFSSRLIGRTKELEGQVDGLVFESKSTQIRVHNTFNEFLMLSNNQFVENRVYLDDLEEHMNGEPNKGIETDLGEPVTEATIISKYTSAIGLALQYLPSFILQDEEEPEEEIVEGEENAPKRVKRETNEFSKLPLPAVIDTDEFMGDDYCGLQFIEEEEEIYISGAETGAEGDKDASDFSSEDEEMTSSGAPPPPPPPFLAPKSVAAAENSEGEEEVQREEEENREEGEEKTEEEEEGPLDFRAELARKLGGGAPKKKEKKKEEEREEERENDDGEEKEKEKEDEPSEKPVKKPPQNIFEDEEEEPKERDIFADEDSVFGSTSRANRATLAFGEEEDLFASISKGKGGSASLFDDEDVPQLSKKEKRHTTAISTASNLASEAAKSRKKFSLFDDDEDAGLFSAPKKSSVDSESTNVEKSGTLFSGDEEKPKEAKKEAKKVSLFSNEESEDVFTAPKTTKARPKTMSLFGDEEEDSSFTSSLPPPKKKAASLFGDDDEEEKPSETKKETKKEEVVKKESSVLPPVEDAAEEPVKSKPVSKKPSLFGDDEEPEKKSSATSKKPSLFGDDESVDVASTSKPKPATKKVSLFGDDDDDTSSSVLSIESKKPVKKSALFGDDEETLPEKPIMAPEKKVEEQPKKKTSLFGDDEEAPTTKVTTKSEEPKKKVSLFGDDEPEEKKETAANKPTKTNLFGDEEPIKADDPFGDFFESKKPAEKKPEKKEEKKVTINKSSPLTTSSDINPLGETSDKSIKVVPPSGAGKIASLQNKLALDPTKMLGGPPPKRASVHVESQDDNDDDDDDDDEQPRSRAKSTSTPQPSHSEVESNDSRLTSLTKSRPAASGRRLPSRKGTTKGSATKTKPRSVSNSKSLFGSDEPASTSNLVDSDIFGSAQSSVISASKKPVSSSLFGDEEPTKVNKPETTSLFDSAFSSSASTTKNNSNLFESPSAPSGAKNEVFDDLFSAPSSKKVEDKPAPSSVSDIFGDPTEPKAKATTKKKAPPPSLFD